MNRHEIHVQLELLRLQLQTAIEIEHTTLPPYLTAAFSIHPDANRDAQAIVRGVAMQEMLHMTLAANVLNAVGGRPIVNRWEFIPGYPTNLPWHARGFSVGLERFSRDQIMKFRSIEQPAEDNLWADRPALKGLAPDANASAVLDAFQETRDEYPPPARGYHTIGQFYRAVALRLLWVVNQLGEDTVFCGDPARQVGPEHYYGAGGQVIEVRGLKHALRAIWTIVREGEGTSTSVWDGDREPATPRQPAHFYAYDELLQGRAYQRGDAPGAPTGEEVKVDWEAVYPMRPNPRRQDYRQSPEVFAAMGAFDDLYLGMLAHIDAAFNGEQHRLREAVAQMYQLRYSALALMRTPDPRDPGRNVGPTWGSRPPGTHPAFLLWEGDHSIFQHHPELR